MNRQQQIIRESMEYIFNQYIHGLSINIKNKINPKVLISQQQIIESVLSKKPYFIADEVLYFLLSVNEQLVKTSECLLIEEVDIFPLFPFPFVLPLSLSPDKLDSWEEMEEYLDLFMGEHWFLRSPRLNKSLPQAPIYCLRQDIDDYESSGIICYSSLTNLILMVAECYRQEAYYVQDSLWKEDLKKSEVIFQQFNEGLLFKSPNSADSFF
jgi:hypothetical protein